MPENTGGLHTGTDIPTGCLACKALTIPAMRPIGRVEHGPDGAFNGRVGLGRKLRQGLKVRLTHLNREVRMPAFRRWRCLRTRTALGLVESCRTAGGGGQANRGFVVMLYLPCPSALL